MTDIRYQVFGCGFTMAACAVAAELAAGLGLDDVQTIDAKRLDTALEGLPAERSYCAELAVEALMAAVRSARNGRNPVQASLHNESEHGPRVTAENPVYTALVNSPKPDPVSDEDRHLFACLLAVAVQEPFDAAAALGLVNADLSSIMKTYFSGSDRSFLDQHSTSATEPPPERNDEVLSILLSHVPDLDNQSHLPAVWLSHILAARASHPGHLWVAMGLFKRPELTAAIRRHLPALAEANQRNMRWKRYLFKQVCDLNGGSMCKTPNCGECSDYALCFEVES